MNKILSTKTITSMFTHCRRSRLLLAAALALVAVPALAKGTGDHDKPGSGYLETNLISDLPGLAQLQDPDLVNPWGISFSATGAFWISDNGSGLSTLYAVTNDAGGGPHVVKQGLEVAIPGEGNPTGQLFDGVGSFNGDIFIFAGEDGTISGWRPALNGAAELLVSRTNAVYKGITMVTIKGKAKGNNGYAVGNAHDNSKQKGGSTVAPLLMLANFGEGTVDIYDTSLHLTQISDPTVPAGYAPFNVQNIGGMVFVTYAKQDNEKHDDVAGIGHGLIDVLDMKTGKFTRFATGTDAGGTLRSINSPWGVVLAPKTFGEHGDELLVGNFGSGTIMTFSGSGKFSGLLEDTNDVAMSIDGLWGLSFGNGGSAGMPNALYFTAGIGGEADGLFGRLTPASAKQKKDNDGE